MDEEERSRTVDQPFYEQEIAPFLPPVVLDFHAHTWRRQDWHAVPWEARATGASYMVTEDNYPVESLLADGKRIFPGREYRAVCFGYPSPLADNAKDTAYVAEAGKRRGLYPLMVTGSSLGVPKERLRSLLDEHGFLGYKVYLGWHGDDYGDLRVQDMLGANEMDLAQERGLVVLLHVPRSGRLADPVIQEGVRWLSRGWPGAKIVLAHCGRCYLPAEMEKAIRSLRDLSNVYLDTSMVMDETVLRMVFDGVESNRVLFATDLPIAAMRGRRVRVMDHWVDIVSGVYPPSEYRIPAEGIRATFMVWEIALAVVSAGRAAGLRDMLLRDVFFENGMRVLQTVHGGAAVPRVEAGWDT